MTRLNETDWTHSDSTCSSSCCPRRQVDANGDARVAFDEFVRVMAPLLQDSSRAHPRGQLSLLVEERAPGEELALLCWGRK